MSAGNRHTFNPALHFDVVIGGYDLDFFLNRTLAFTLEDHARRYDQITWRLDNRDGALTDIEHMALGLMLRVRLGYADDTQGWRTFIISRMRGGVGVMDKTGAGGAAVGSNESVIEFSGRNRNAPDLRGRRGKKSKSSKKSPYISSSKPTGRGGALRAKSHKGSSTSDITAQDSAQRSAWHGPVEGDRRIFQVRHLSDAVREIALRIGYADENIFVQDTDDEVAHIVIPTGMTDADFLTMQKEKLGWVMKMGDKNFYFHEERWVQAKEDIKATYTYGGPDVLSLNVDFDFRLPVPNAVKAKGYDPILRGQVHSQADAASSAIQDTLGLLHLRDDDGSFSTGKNQRKYHLQRDSVYAIPGGTKKLASARAQGAFIRRHVRAIKVNLKVVGDPDVVGGDNIKIRGTGSPLVDGLWYVNVARQVFSGTTYVTEFDLRAPSKRSRKGRIINLRGDLHDPEATEKGMSGLGQIQVRGRITELRQLSLPTPGSADVGGK